MLHRGEIVRKAIYESGITITEVAKCIGKSRRWMYLMFENNNVPLDLILEIGRIIHHDFSHDFKELRNSVYENNVPEAKYIKNEPSAAYWKDKYLRLLEEYNELLKSLNDQEHK